ncbi:hypothetical protein GNF67_18865, partial [Clostridium perfringens]|nr:hypothetical protein [Clostridium perfringens]
EKPVYKKHLEIAVEVAEEVTEEELKDVVPAVVEEFKAALEEAKGILGNEKVTQTKVDNSFDRLSKAMQMLSFKKGDKAALQALMDKIATLSENEFISSTWVKLQTTLEVANKVMADENAMVEEVNETYDNLMRAF